MYIATLFSIAQYSFVASNVNFVLYSFIPDTKYKSYREQLASEDATPISISPHKLSTVALALPFAGIYRGSTR